jgi:hypothetical protein
MLAEEVMSRWPVLAVVLFLAMLVVPSPAQDSSPPQNTHRIQKESSTPAADVNEPEDIATLKSDLQRMQATVYQMQTNLAFVGSTTTPLYHEFELDIQMWQMMIAQMQRRVDRLEKQRGTAK